jgi:hypothetical protein
MTKIDETTERGPDDENSDLGDEPADAKMSVPTR